MTTSRCLFLVLLVVGAAIAAPSLQNTAWELVRLNGTTMTDPARFRLTFDTATVHIGTDCNGCGGSYTATTATGAFQISATFCTDMACAGDVYEGEYLAALAGVTTYSATGDSLYLTGDGIDLVYRKYPPTSTAARQLVPARRQTSDTESGILLDCRGRTVAHATAGVLIRSSKVRRPGLSAELLLRSVP